MMVDDSEQPTEYLDDDRIDALFAIIEAQEGRLEPLRRRLINTRVTLTSPERLFLAKHLTMKKPAHRQKTLSTTSRRHRMALEVHSLVAEGVQKSAAVSMVAEDHKVKVGVVYNAVKDTPVAKSVVANSARSEK